MSDADGLFHVKQEKRYCMIPWWPGRVAFRRDVEAFLNELVYADVHGRVRWHIFGLPIEQRGGLHVTSVVRFEAVVDTHG